MDLAVSGVPAHPAPAAPDQPAGGAPAFPAVRLVTGFAAFGAGSVDLAISSSFFAGGTGTPGTTGYVAGAIAGVWGAVLLAAGVTYLARGRVPGRRAGPVLGTAAGLHVAAIAASPPEASRLNLSHLAALLLTLMIVAAVAWLRRNSAPHRLRATAATEGTASPGRLLLAAFAGAVLVAGIATPGLAASTPGQYAVPHGEHGQGEHGQGEHGTATVPGGHHQR
ncbi:hypothetical protein [Arthrobacter sp. AD-310]